MPNINDNQIPPYNFQPETLTSCFNSLIRVFLIHKKQYLNPLNFFNGQFRISVTHIVCYVFP